MTFDLIIIGAGAAGLFASANAPVGWRTLVLEKTDKPGQKLLLTGSGQCNFTNNESIKAFITRYGNNGKHLRSVLFPFSNLALMEYFKQNELPIHIREDGKVFPTSMNSADVLNLLLRLSRDRNVSIQYNGAVTDIVYQEENKSLMFVLKTTREQFYTKRLLVATGGASYPQTGSDGAFFDCLKRLGLTLIPGRPALVPVNVRDYPYSELSGLTFSNSLVEIYDKNGECSGKAKGDLLFTHNNFSGPVILKISRYATKENRLNINYLPDKTNDSLRVDLLRAATGDGRQIITLLGAITALPRSFLELVCSSVNIEKNKKSSSLTGKEMGALATRITADSYEISGTGGRLLPYWGQSRLYRAAFLKLSATALILKKIKKHLV